MSGEIDRYDGREHSFIKHRFLSAYLKAASFKVLQGSGAARTFTYVDGFAGPWSVSDEEDCSDSSFDYAVRVLRDTRSALTKMGTQPRLRFLLCEKDPDAFGRLTAYAQSKSDIDIHVFKGEFEDNLDEIRLKCEGFTFTFIDPKGWKLRGQEIRAFLSKVRGDFLFNFMEHPISRHNSLSTVHSSFSQFLSDPSWDKKLTSGPGAPPREHQILDLLKGSLRQSGAARYLPDFAIKKPRAERVQMRLVLGSHHPHGVEVFRAVQRSIEAIQVETRASIAEEASRQSQLFDRSQVVEIDLAGTGVGGEKSRRAAEAEFLRLLALTSSATKFGDAAVLVMEGFPVRLTDMKDIAVKLRSEGRIDFTLEGRARKPSDETLVCVRQS